MIETSTLFWILGAVLTVVLGLIGVIYKFVTKQITDLKIDVLGIMKKNGAINGVKKLADAQLAEHESTSQLEMNKMAKNMKETCLKVGKTQDFHIKQARECMVERNDTSKLANERMANMEKECSNKGIRLSAETKLMKQEITSLKDLVELRFEGITKALSSLETLIKKVAV